MLFRKILIIGFIGLVLLFEICFLNTFFAPRTKSEEPAISELPYAYLNEMKRFNDIYEIDTGLKTPEENGYYPQD